MTWTAVYPNRSAPWAAIGADGRSPALFDPDTGVTSLVDPRADERLPGLAPALGSGDLLSYRPGRRAVVRRRDETGWTFVKVVRPDRVTTLTDRHQAFATVAGVAGFATPELVDVDAAMGLVTLSAVEGVRLGDGLWTIARSTLYRLGGALGAIARQDPPSGLPSRSNNDAVWWMEAVARWDPTMPTTELHRVERLIDTVGTGDTESPLHGDLHDKNILVDRGRLGLVDLDGAARGPLVTDLASLVAQIELRAIDHQIGPERCRERWTAVCEGFGDVVSLSVPVLSTAVGAELARLACVYRFRRAGREMTTAILDAAERRMQGAWA